MHHHQFWKEIERQYFPDWLSQKYTSLCGTRGAKTFTVCLLQCSYMSSERLLFCVSHFFFIIPIYKVSQISATNYHLKSINFRGRKEHFCQFVMKMSDWF